MTDDAERIDRITAALDLGLQAWRTTPARDRFIDAIADIGWLRVRLEQLAKVEEAAKGLVAEGDEPGEVSYDAFEHLVAALAASRERE